MQWNINDLEEYLLIGSTLVEGSTLTETESRQVLSGQTIFGHPISEARELLNYRHAVEWIMKEFDASPYLSVDLIQHFHRLLFQGFPGVHGKWKTTANYTYRSDGSRFDYERPEKISNLIQDWIKEFNTDPPYKKSMPEKTSALYYQFQKIHPFEDGNGRIGRILIAYWLHWKWNCFFEFRLKDKFAHLEALEAANSGDLKKLSDFFKQRIHRE